MSSDSHDYNADELEAPDWLNKQFLQDVLVQHFKDHSIAVDDLKMSPASAKGDHYASVMFRAKVEYSTLKGKFSKSLIIKTMPQTEGHKKEFLGDSQIFQTEIAMYTQILPLFESILRAAGEQVKFCPTCLYHSLQPRQVMIFEDLVELGYQVIRNRNATRDELRSVLALLAKWQAVSFKLLQEQPQMFARLQYDVSTIPNFLEQPIMVEGLGNFLDMISQEESLKQYAQYFEPMRKNILIRWQDVIREFRERRQENAYYVLCHGDFHVRNMMFKGNDCLLLDFQMSYVGSIANDLQYAKYMLFGADERRHRCDELFHYYYETFARTLLKIGFQGENPSLVNFRRQIFDRRSSEYLLLTTFMPASYYMRQGNDPGDLLQDASLRKQVCQDSDYKKELEYLLPRMLHQGYFELPEGYQETK